MIELWRSLRTRAFRAAFRIESRRLRRFRGVHGDGVKRCFVIGNGPSIKQQNLTLLRDEYTFASNLFLLHEDFDKVGLNYLCVSNPKFWTSGSLPPNMLEAIERYPQLVLFFEHTFWRLNLRQKLIDRGRCYSVYIDYKRPAYKGHVSLDPSKRTHHGHTVIVDLCLPLAYYMGFREVYLLGCDCDYGLDDAPDHSKAYFYDIKEHEVKPDDADYLRGRWVQSVFASYEVMKGAFEAGGGTIYNATRGGKLEVFPRRQYEDVICQA